MNLIDGNENETDDNNKKNEMADKIPGSEHV